MVDIDLAQEINAQEYINRELQPVIDQKVQQLQMEHQDAQVIQEEPIEENIRGEINNEEAKLENQEEDNME